MKLLFLHILLISGISFSQNSSSNYEIVSIGSKYSKVEIENAFNSANLCGLYLQDVRNTIVLNDGSKINILSASELSNSSLLIQKECVSSEIVKNISWSISSGVLLRSVEGVVSPDNKIYIIK